MNFIIRALFIFGLCATQAQAQFLTTTGGSATPTGAAGGSLGGTYPNPSLAPVNSIATSLAIGGATIGTDGLGVTGTVTVSGTVTAGSFIPTSSSAPANGMYLSAANTLAWSTSSSRSMYIAGNILKGNAAASAALNLGLDASSTLPTLIPNQSSTSTGIGAQASGNVSVITGGAENTRFTSTGLSTVGFHMIGSATPLTLTAGALGMQKITASASAPGAAGVKLEAVCGTNAGTAKLIMYAGTSGTAVTVIDNVGTGVTGC